MKDQPTRTHLIHTGSKVAQPALFPVGRTAAVSTAAKDMLEDFRMEACAFGQASAAAEVERRWMNMQMRFHELAEYVGGLEQSLNIGRDVVMKF